MINRLIARWQHPSPFPFFCCVPIDRAGVAPPILGNLVSNRPRTGRSLIFNRETKLIPGSLVLFPNYSSEMVEFMY